MPHFAHCLSDSRNATRETRFRVETVRNACLLAMAGIAAVIPSRGESQTSYPTRPVRIIAPSAPGGAADTFARVVAQPPSERLGEPVAVEPRAGAGTVIGTEIVARAD